MSEIKRIIFLSADPQGDRSGYDRELRALREGLERSKWRESFAIQVLTAARTEDLRRALLSEPWALHVCGWGMGTRGLTLEDGGVASPEAFRDLMALARGLHLVFFSACYSEELAHALAGQIPFVVGMRDSPAEEVMRTFSLGFYDALFAGRNVADAFKSGAVSIRLESLPDSDKPLIFSRPEQADDLPAWLGEHTELGRYLQRLQPGRVAFLDQINADRRRERKTYRQRIEQRIDPSLPLQFLLLPVCPDQKPESFIERMALEWEEEHETRVLFQKRKPADRLHVEKLPDSFSQAQKKTRKYFAELAQLPEAETFGPLLAPGSRLPATEWLAACFSWQEEEWDEKEARRYFEWLTGAYFREAPPGPQMALIFVVEMPGLHQHPWDRERARTVESMARLAAEFQQRHLQLFLPPDAEEPGSEVLVRQFLPVERRDLESWLESLGESGEHAEQLLDLMAPHLKPKEQERYQQKGLIDMRRMEQLQRALYRIHSQRI